MKKILFFFLLIPVIAFAQNGEPVSDTAYIFSQQTAAGLRFYEVKTFVYQDGSELTSKTLIGDSLTLLQSATAKIQASSASWAVDIRHVSTFKRKITATIREADQGRTLTGTDPQREIQMQQQAAFLEPGWKIRRDGTASDIVFTVNAQGALRYSVAGGQTRGATTLGSAMRLNNYPSSGTDTDLYVLPSGVWINADRSVILRPPNNNSPVNR